METRRTQIANLIRQRLLGGAHLGTLGPGQRLQSARELADELDADPRVVMAAYRQLEQEGLIEIRPRSGIFVAPAHAVQSQMQRRTADWMVNLLLEGLGRGITAKEFAERLRQGMETVRLRVACIECSQDQLAALACELEDDYGMDANRVDSETLMAGAPIPEEIRHADLLLTTRFHIVEVEPIATALGKPWIVAEQRVDRFADIAHRILVGPVYFLLADPRFGEKLNVIFGLSSGVRNLHPLVAGRDDLGAVPEDAPLYVTRLAAEQVGVANLPPRSILETRTFTRETSRELFTFMVRKNLAARPELRTDP